MKSIRPYLIIAALGLFAIAACTPGKDKTGYVYFPDMHYHLAYETYDKVDIDSVEPGLLDSSVWLAQGQVALRPVQGTVPRGYQPFPYENTGEEWMKAGEELTNPVPANEENIGRGKAQYEIYCAICHGSDGEGNGFLVESGKFPAQPPSYFRKDIMDQRDGQIYFTIHYGKGNMGSYASQISQEDRWNIVHYINQMQDEKAGETTEEGDASQDSATVK